MAFTTQAALPHQAHWRARLEAAEAAAIRKVEATQEAAERRLAAAEADAHCAQESELARHSAAMLRLQQQAEQQEIMIQRLEGDNALAF